MVKKKKAAGFVIRDHSGNHLLASSNNIGHVDVLAVEAIALREDLRQNRFQFCPSGRSRGDYKILIESINGVIQSGEFHDGWYS